jgi:hypothetical protein
MVCYSLSRTQIGDAAAVPIVEALCENDTLTEILYVLLSSGQDF